MGWAAARRTESKGRVMADDDTESGAGMTRYMLRLYFGGGTAPTYGSPPEKRASTEVHVKSPRVGGVEAAGQDERV